MSDILTLILAAGKSTRMKSTLSKVLHSVASRPMVAYVFDLAKQISGKQIYTIINPELEALMKQDYSTASHFIIQPEQKGTGHAVKIALDAIDEKTLSHHEWLLVLYGDAPLLQKETLDRMIEMRDDQTAIILSTMHVSETNQYGRVIENQGKVQKIVEYKDASDAAKSLTLCNGGVMLIKSHFAKKWLADLKPSSVSGEFYLTDLVASAVKEGHPVKYCEMPPAELSGVNNRSELAHVESVMQGRLREKVMLGGATLLDPRSVYFAYDTQIGKDVLIEPHVFFGPKVKVDDHVHIKAFSHLENCHLKAASKIGPFARLRPGTEIGKNSAVGNFVEIKNSKLHRNVKAGHLSYIGDTEIHDDVNIGAGTITCNYDGKNKHKTEIETGAFIGSNTALIAPVKVGKHTLVAAGSVITKPVPDNMLAITRSQQKNMKRKK